MRWLLYVSVFFALSLMPFLSLGQVTDTSEIRALQELSEAEEEGEELAIGLAHRELAEVYLKQNRFPLARDHFLESLSLLEGKEENPVRAQAMQDLGDAYLRVGSLEEALQQYERADTLMRTSEDLNKLGRLLAKKSFAYLNQGNFDVAEQNLADATSTVLNAEPTDSNTLADIYITSGILHSKQAQYPKALEFYDHAGKIYESLESRQRLIFVYNNMSGAYLAWGNTPRALDYLQKTLRLSEEFEFKTGILSSLSNIAMVYMTHEDHTKALEYLERAKVENEAAGDSLQLARILNNMGASYQKMGQTSKAFQHFNESLALRNSLGDQTGIASTELRLGVLQTESGNFATAKNHLVKSREIWELVGDDKGLSESTQELGILALAQNQFAEARALCQQSYTIARELNLAEEVEASSACLATAYEGMGDYRNALIYQQKSTAARDSLRNDEQTKAITRLEMQYDFDAEKDSLAIVQARSEALLTARIHRQRTVRNASLGGLLAGLLILALLYRSYRLKQKSNQLLETKNQTIQKTLEERETLLKEIHHRVKNNLQVVSSLLSLQSRSIADPVALGAIEEGRNRVKAMALIHQNLYQEGKLVGVDLPEYIKKLTDSLVNSYRINTTRIGIRRDIAPMSLDVDLLIPLGLILNELISNALKYAFPERDEGNITIAIQRMEEGLNVLVSDDGVGMPSGFSLENTQTLGFKLINSFVEKMKAKLEILTQNGVSISILLPHQTA